MVGKKPFASDIAVLEHYRLKSSLHPTFDNTFNRDSETILYDAIHEMLQRDQSARPTAATLLDTFSMHGLAAKMQDIQIRLNEKSLIDPVESRRPDVAAYFPIFRRLLISDLRVMSAVLEVLDQREWIVVFIITNMSSIRIAIVFYDVDREYSKVTLWDAASGSIIWRRQYPWNRICSRADPTFSGDGKHFGVHHGDQVVEILDAQSATLVNTIGIQSEGRITVIAILNNGKGAVIAVERRILNKSTTDADMATLNDIGGDVNMDIVQTHAMSGVSLVYDPRGWYLFLVGNSISRGGHGEYEWIGFCWDIISRSEPMIFPGDETRIISSWTTPLYNMSFNNFAVFRSFISNAHIYFEIITSIQLYGNILYSENYCVCGFNNHSLLVLGNEDQFQVWDGSQND